MRNLLILLKELLLCIILTTLVFIFIGLMVPVVGLFMIGLFVWGIIELLMFGYRLLKDLVY